MILGIGLARVSTGEQGENYSLPTQRDAIHAYASANGIDLVTVVEEVGSGATLDRPGLRRVRDAITSGAVQAVVVHTADRLTRDLAHWLLLRDELRRHNVILHIIARGGGISATPESDLFSSIDHAFAEYERKKIQERTVRGLRGKVESGSVTGRGGMPPYGYAYVGTKREKIPVIAQHEAVIVRLIYEWFCGGAGVQEIRRRLEAQGVPTPSDNGRRVIRNNRERAAGQWSSSTIYRILGDEKYAGTFRALPASLRRKDKAAAAGVAYPAIIDRATWEVAQGKLKQGATMQRRNTKRAYLLRCRITCSCGYGVSGHTWMRAQGEHKTYRCNGRLATSVHRCTMPLYPVDIVDAVVWRWIEQEVLDEERLRIGLEAQQNRADDSRLSLASQRDDVIAQRDKAAREILRLNDRYAQGKLSEEEADALIAPRRAQLASATQRLAELDQQLAGASLQDATVAALQETVQALRQRLKDDTTYEEKRAVVDVLDVRAVLVLVDGRRYLDVSCALPATGRLLVEPGAVSSTFCVKCGTNRPQPLMLRVRLALPEASEWATGAA